MKFRSGISALVLFVRIAGALLQLVLVAAVLSMYSLEAVGLNGLLWSGAVISRTAGAFGVDVLTLRSLSRHSDEDRPILLRHQALYGLRIVLLMWLIIGCAVVLLLFAVPVGVDMVLLVACVATVSCISAISKMCTIALIATGRVVASQAIESVALPVLGIVGLVAVAGVGSTEALLLSQVGAFLVSLLLFLFASRNVGARGSDGRNMVDRLSAYECFNVALGSLATALSVRSAIFFVAGSSASAAGAFEVAQRVQTAGAMGATAVATVALPDVAKIARVGPSKEANRYFFRTSLAAAILPVLAILCLPALWYLLKEYTDTPADEITQTALVLLLSTLVNSSTLNFFSLLNYAKMTRLAAIVGAGQFAVMVLLFCLLPGLSAVQGALVVLTGELLRSFILAFLFARWRLAFR